MKKIITTLLVFVLLSGIAFALFNLSAAGKKWLSFYKPAKKITHGLCASTFKKLQTKASVAKAFAEKNNYNNRICFLVDLGDASNTANGGLYGYD